MTPKTLARAAMAVAAALLTGACSTAAGSTTAGGTPAPAPAPARLTYALPADPARMVLPTTGAESRWTQGLDAFGQQVASSVTADCAREHGFALPEQVPPAFISYSNLPDLAFLGRHGFGHGAEVPGPGSAWSRQPAGSPGSVANPSPAQTPAPLVSPAPSESGSPASAKSGSPAQIRDCQTRGSAAAGKVRGVYLPLQKRWFGELATTRDDPAAEAIAALPRCLAKQGYRVRDEDAFFSLVDSRLMKASSADFARVDTALGSVYATCMRPVEAVREPARRALRERFLADNAQEIRALRAALVPALRRAEKEYGVRLAFPAP
ncbi:hypothetical protein [Streptomyces hokutonensis]|uniref:Lipoprotein n=1 Tax=Streptomyces hokutonensis TaxID=1306990 RepID=A0ABW6MK34_9ACTN